MALDPTNPVDETVYDVDRFSDLVNALEWGLLGGSDSLNGYLNQSDYKFLNEATMDKGGEQSIRLIAPGSNSTYAQPVLLTMKE